MNGSIALQILILSASFAATLILTVLVRTSLLKRALLDHPNERSAHTVPVPRGGGWALLIVLLPAMAITSYLQNNLAEHVPLFASVIILALISWQDDRKGVSAIRRLSLHILAACVGSLSFSTNDLLLGGMAPFWLDRALMIVGWAWFMNLYNFMDGIDGITGAETISIASGVCFLFLAGGISNPFVSTLALILTGVALGFLALNWYPAKIFLGDVGSVPLGFLTGFLLLSLAVKGFLVPALILPLYYLADSGITIIKRACRREKIWQAHRQHFYQQAALKLGRHDAVVCWIIVANLGLISAALIAVTHAALGFGLGAAAVAILLWKMHKPTHAPLSP